MRIGKEPFRDIYIYTHTSGKDSLEKIYSLGKTTPFLLNYIFFFSQYSTDHWGMS